MYRFFKVLDLEVCHQIVVSLGVFALEVLHQAAAFADFLDKTASGAEVLFVALQVFREILDFRREDGDLDLRRTGIRIMSFVLLDNTFLLCCVEHVVVGICPHCLIAPRVRLGGFYADHQTVRAGPG